MCLINHFSFIYVTSVRFVHFIISCPIWMAESCPVWMLVVRALLEELPNLDIDS